jgi:hypothetical protein
MLAWLEELLLWAYDSAHADDAIVVPYRGFDAEDFVAEGPYIEYFDETSREYF